MKTTKNLAIVLSIFGMLVATNALAAILGTFQGGTGTGENPSAGSILVGSSTNAYSVFGVGADGTFLAASSTAAHGISWMSVAGGSGITFINLNGVTSTDFRMVPGAGIGISTSTNGTTTVTNMGVQSATGSAYLNVSSATGTPTFTNLGVQTLTCSTGLSCSSATGTVTIAGNIVTTTINSVTSQRFDIKAGAGINIATTTNGTSTVSNTGVTSLVAGSSTIVSNATGTVTVSAPLWNAPWTILAPTGTLATSADCSSSICLDQIYTLDRAAKLSKVRCKGTMNGDTVTYNVYYGVSTTAATATGTLRQMFSSDQTCTATSTYATVNASASTTPAAGDMLFIWYKNTSTTKTHWDVYFDYL